MVQVPVVANPSELPSKSSPVYQNLNPNDAAWTAVGRAMGDFGEKVGSFGAVLAANQLKMQNERDAADANNAWLSASLEAGQVNADYFAKEGSNAADGFKPYTESLEEIRQRHLEKLGSEKAKKLFDNDFTRSVVTDINAGARHAATQAKAYASQQSEARVLAAVKDSAARFGSQEAFDNNLLVIKRETERRGQSEGWSGEKLAFETDKAQGVAYAARMREMAIYDPFGAEKLFKAHMDKLDPDAVPVIENAIRTSRLTVGVKQGIGVIYGQGDIGRPSLVKGMMSLERFKSDPTANLKLVSAGLQDSIAAGATHLPPGYRIEVTEGYSATGHRPKSQHKVAGRGAVDLYIIDPNGNRIPREGADSTGMYARLYKGTLVEMRARHPELVSYLRWGGQFETAPGSGKADLMHFDLGGRGGGPGRARVGAGKIEGGAGGFTGRVIGGFADRVIGAESGGRSGLISPAGAVGIMQILPDTAKEAAAQMGIPYSYEHLLHDNSYNVSIGKHILNRLLNKYGGNEALAAAAYNAGERDVDKWFKAHGEPKTAEEVAAFAATMPKETQGYIAKVLGSEGVGYDPAPGQQYFHQNLNTGTGATGNSLATRLAQAQDYANQVAPGDDEYLERLLSATRTRYGIEDAANTEETQAAYDFVVSNAISNKITNEEQLLSDRVRREAYEKLDATKQIAVRNLLESLSKDDIPETTPMQERFFRYRETLNNGTEEQKKALPDPYATPPKGEPPFSNAQKKALSEIRTAKKPATPASAAEKLSVESKFNLLKEALQAAGLIVPAGDQTETTRNNLAAFKGQFTYELNELAKSHPNTPVTDQEAIQLGSDLMQKVSFLQPDPLWPGVLPFVGAEVPLYIMSKKDLQNYFNVPSDAAEVIMKQEVPESARRNIIESITRRTGRAPTSEEVIWKVYQHGMFEMQRNTGQEGPPGTGGKFEFAQ